MLELVRCLQASVTNYFNVVVHWPCAAPRVSRVRCHIRCSHFLFMNDQTKISYLCTLAMPVSSTRDNSCVTTDMICYPCTPIGHERLQGFGLRYCTSDLLPLLYEYTTSHSGHGPKRTRLFHGRMANGEPGSGPFWGKPEYRGEEGFYKMLASSFANLLATGRRKGKNLKIFTGICLYTNTYDTSCIHAVALNSFD